MCESNRTVTRDQVFTVFLVAFEQEHAIHGVDYFEKIGVGDPVVLEKLAAHTGKSVLEFLAPLLNALVKSEVLRVNRMELLNLISSILVEVEVTNGLCIVVHEDGVTHLPDRQGSAVEERLDAVLGVLEIELGAQVLLEHALEDDRLNLLVHDEALEFPVEKLVNFSDFLQDCLVHYLNTIASV